MIVNFFIGFLLMFNILPLFLSLDFEKCYQAQTFQLCFKTSIDRDLKIWNESKSLCSSNGNGYTLPEIVQQEEDDIFNRFISDADMSNDDIWLGGVIKTSATYICNSLMNTCSLKIVSNNTEPAFMTIKNNGSIFAREPSQAAFYLCKILSGCSGSGCYNLFKNSTDYFTAVNRCQKKGMALATFENIDNFNEAMGILTNEECWVNIRKSTLVWDNTKRNIVYTNFIGSLPTFKTNETLCLVKQTRGSWQTRSCVDARNDKSATVCMKRTNFTNPSAGGNNSCGVTDFKPCDMSSFQNGEYCLNNLGLGLLIGIGAAVWILSLIMVGVSCRLCCRSNKKQQKPAGNRIPELPPANQYSDPVNSQYASTLDEDKNDSAETSPYMNRDSFDNGEYANADTLRR